MPDDLRVTAWSFLPPCKTYFESIVQCLFATGYHCPVFTRISGQTDDRQRQDNSRHQFPAEMQYRREK